MFTVQSPRARHPVRFRGIGGTVACLGGGGVDGCEETLNE